MKLPLGIDDFRKMRTRNLYYVDKSEFIYELLSESFEVNLITRPRRFGKTLTMSMLAEFFDIRKDSRELFEGLAISRRTAFCQEWMNQWPVLFLTLKDADGKDFRQAYGLLQFILASLCIEHAYLGKSEKVDEDDKIQFARLKSRESTVEELQSGLFLLTRMMASHYGKEVILLIDEYDVPLSKADDNRYYDDMLNIIRRLLGMAWKTNPFLKFAVVTGCLHIAKESIFTGANNFILRSISHKHYDRWFGFLEEEVVRILSDAGLSNQLAQMKRWYDGYRFGGREVYCPWDVVNYVNELLSDSGTFPANYWKDTSHNGIIRRFIDMKGMQVHDKFEILLAGGVIQEQLVGDLTYDLVHSNEENLWSILYLTGYLTKAAPEAYPAGFCLEEGKTALRIPNEEVKTIFADTVAQWFAEGLEAMDRTKFFQAWWDGDEESLTRMVTDILFDTISYFDDKEDYYHAFVAGLFAGAGYEVSSNSEQGAGRADVVVRDRRNRRAMIIEVKRSKAEEQMVKDCQKAAEQIRKMQYAKQLLKGYRKVLCFGAAFFGKECLIRYYSS